MSSILNMVVTDFRARGTQVTAAMREMAAGTRTWAGGIQDATRQSDRLNSQWRAIGTTIHYAIAGQAVFGLTRMVGQLKDVQVQMGLIAAVGQQAGGGLSGRPFSSSQVTQMGNELQVAAANSMTSISDMNDAAINFLSTVQNVNRSDLPGILQDIARGAQLSQTPIEDLTQLVTTMNIAFGRRNTPQNIAQNVRQWWALIATAPGGIKAAPQLVQAIPTVSTIFRQGLTPGKSPERQQAEMMSLILGSLRFGATPSTAMRGLAFFLQSLETPASAQAQKALTGIGITPQSVRRKGIYQTTLDFLQHVSGNLSANQLRTIQSIPEENLTEGMQLPGVAPDQMQFLRTSLGRIHAVRAAIVLASQLRRTGDVASLEEQLNLMLGAQNDTIRGTTDMSQAWQRYSQRAKLTDMANRVNIMLLQIAQSFEGILNFFATDIVNPITKFAQEHRKLTKDAALGAVGVGAALGLAGFLRGRGIFSRGIGGVAVAQSLAGQEADGSAAHPFFVIVLSQMSGTGGPSIRGPGPIIPTPTKGPGVIGNIAKVVGPAVVSVAATQAIADATNKRYGPGPLDKAFWTDQPSLLDIIRGKGKMTQQTKQEWRNVATDLKSAANWGWGGIKGLFGGEEAKAATTPLVTIHLNVKQPDGSTDKIRIHVPRNLFSNGSVPSQGGKVAVGRR